MLRRLGIERGEAELVAWAAAVLFLLGWADVSVKNVSEVFFIKRGEGVELLPLVFLASNLLLVGTTFAVGSLAARSDRSRLLPVTLLILGLALLPLWLMVRQGTGFSLLVIASKQFQSIALLVFLQALGDLLHPRQAKRLLSPLMAGMTLGFMLGSFASDPLADWLGREGLLPFSSAVFVLAAAFSLPMRRGARGRLGRRAESNTGAAMAAVIAPAARERTSLGRLWRESQLFRLLAGLTAFNALLGPMLYFQFQYVADIATAGQNGEDRLLEIYAQFRGWISVGILIIQLGFASGLYRRIGLPLAACFSPVVYLLGFIGLSAQLSLAAGVGALAGTKLVDNAVYDPALRVLYNLFREGIRSRASALLEGPIKRSGGVIGNAVTGLAVWVGSAGWVGYLALPMAGLWLGIAVVLWRLYPSLLVKAASRRGSRGFDRLPIQELLDRNTERVLAQRLVSPDPEVCRVAMDLCSEADPLRAVAGFARAARDAPEQTRSLLVSGLDRILEAAVADPFMCRSAAEDLEELLDAENGVAALDRANAVQGFGRLTHDDSGPSDRERLQRHLSENDPGVRLAAHAALARLGEVELGTLDAALVSTLRESNAVARHIAREEIRALLLQGDPEEDGPAFDARLAQLAGLLDSEPDRAAAAEALADVARRHGAAVTKGAEALIAHWDDPDPRVRAAALRGAGYAGLTERARAIVEHVDDDSDEVAAAARDAIVALGPGAADVLLVELTYGRRSRRDAILRLVSEIEVGHTALQSLYTRELDDLRQTLLHRAALEEGAISPIVLQRLDERLEEGSHAVLQILAALNDNESIAEVSHHFRRAHDSRRRAILIEALEALLAPEEKNAVVPLLDDRPLRDRADATAEMLGTPVPPPGLAVRNLREDRDELTRMLVHATSDEEGAPLARPADLGDHAQMLEPVDIALQLRRTPLFEGLATRYLLEIAGVVKEERYSAGTKLFDAGESGTSMYLIVDGRIRIHRGEREVAQIGAEDFFGEVGLLEGGERSAAATSLTDVRLLRLERDDLLALMEELPGIAISVAQELSRRLRRNLDRLSST